MTMMWATSQKKALKDALKKLFKTRGIPYLWLDDKEFDNGVRLMNYVMKNNKLDQVCHPVPNQSLMHDPSSPAKDLPRSSNQSQI